MAIPTIDQAGAKYAARTSVAAQDWEQRAAASASDWESNAKSPASEAAYAAGVAAAAQQQLRLKGLAAVSGGEWAGRIRGAGNRYREGTARSAGKWGQKFSPYLDRLRSLQPALPARGPRGDARNYERVRAVGDALHQMKVGGGGAIGGAGMAAPGVAVRRF